MERVRAKLSRAWLLQRKALAQRLRTASRADRQRSYVFVAGMQRSGTNMMMDLLERSLETDVYHERDPRAFDDYQMRPRPVIHELATRSHAPVVVIKSLCELQELRSLMDEFSPAKAVWLMRNFEDVVNSMLVSFRNQAKQVQRIAIDRNGSGWLGKGMSDETHEVVRQLVHPALDDASAAALQWYFRNVLYFEQGLDRDPCVLPVAYEGLVADPGRHVPLIFGFLGLDYTPEIAAGVFSSSVRRRTPPTIEAAIRRRCEMLSDRIRATIAARGSA
jgi:hypothetical protein